jgi:hypothetical protein
MTGSAPHMRHADRGPVAEKNSTLEIVLTETPTPLRTRSDRETGLQLIDRLMMLRRGEPSA